MHIKICVYTSTCTLREYRRALRTNHPACVQCTYTKSVSAQVNSDLMEIHAHWCVVLFVCTRGHTSIHSRTIILYINIHGRTRSGAPGDRSTWGSIYLGIDLPGDRSTWGSIYRGIDLPGDRSTGGSIYLGIDLLSSAAWPRRSRYPHSHLMCTHIYSYIRLGAPGVEVLEDVQRLAEAPDDAFAQVRA